MNTIRKGIASLSGVFLLAGCAVQRYRPAPIVPSATASEFESRSLANPGLHSFEEQNLGRPVSPWPLKPWDLQTLSLAALYFNPALESARARAAGAEAALVTAGGRPQPSSSLVSRIPAPCYIFIWIAFSI